MKTVCFVVNRLDANWLAEYWNNNAGKEEISVVAPSFEGRVIAQSLNIPYKCYEEDAWVVNKAKIFDIARRQAYYWHQLPALKSNPRLEAVRTFKGYPLLVMHHPTFFQAFQEIFQSYEFITKIIQKENPDRIVIGKHENPFDSEAQPPFNDVMLNILTASNGLELETLKTLAISRNIEVVVKEIVPNARNTVVENAVALPKEIIWDSRQTGPKVLFFTWGGWYYLQQISEAFDHLLKKGSRIGLVIVGGKLTTDEERAFEQKNVYVTYKSHWHTKNEAGLLLEWKRKGECAFESISQNSALNDYFSESRDRCFTGLAMEAVKANLTKYFPYTVRELIRSENIVNTFNPDVVVAHFAWHPWESSDVLPARMSGIPTLTMGHGISTSTAAPGDTFSTQYYAVNGIAYKEALMKVQGCVDDSVVLVGDCRFDKIKIGNSNTKDVKRVFGLNPESPVCIFCDSSGWSHAFEKRHSTFKTIEKIVALRKAFPELQIIYRVHHGLSSGNLMKAVFDHTKIPGFYFQISPHPLFTEIVQAADFVIAHHTSAIAEALLSGVRVIYLTAFSSLIERDQCCGDVVNVADNFEVLQSIVGEFLNNPISRETVRMMAQPYFDRLLNGCDGKSDERLSLFILKLAETSGKQREKGVHEWINRIEASCKFKMEEMDRVHSGEIELTDSKPKASSNSLMKQAKGYTGHNIAFIVGCPRSGTTWLQRLLACHPKIRSGQESDVFDMFIGPQLRAWRYCLDYKQSGRPVGLTSYLRENEYLSVLRQYMMNLLDPMIGNLQDGEIFVEKTPSHALFIPEIMEMLPDCKIIHVIRDVRDVVASLLAASKTWGQHWAPKDAHSAACMWVQHVQAVRESAKKLSGTQFYELRYEDLTSNTEKILTEVSSFLYLQWSGNSLKTAISDNQIEKTKKNGGTPIPIKGELGSLLGTVAKEPEGFVRKGQPGSWKDDLTSQDLLAISLVARQAMLSVGYLWETRKESETEIKNNWYVDEHKDDVDSSRNVNIAAIKNSISKFMEDGSVSLAEEAIDASLNKYPDSLELQIVKAEFKMQIRKNKDAKNVLLDIIKKKPDHVDVINMLAIIEYNEGQIMSSVEFLKHVLILDKSNQTATAVMSKIKNTCSLPDVNK